MRRLVPLVFALIQVFLWNILSLGIFQIHIYILVSPGVIREAI